VYRVSLDANSEGLLSARERRDRFGQRKPVAVVRDVSLTCTLPPGHWCDEKCLSSGAFLLVQVTVPPCDVECQILYYECPSDSTNHLSPLSLSFSTLSFPLPTSCMRCKGWVTPQNLRTLTVSSPCIFYIPLGRSLTDDPPPDISIALFIVAFIVTSYRCFARYTKRLWGYDDSAALLSLFFFVFFVIGLCNIYFRFSAR
jgi:hypothetical protein